MPTTQKHALSVLVLLGMLAGGWTLLARVRVEQANRTVAIAVDYPRVQELALMRGVPAAVALAEMRKAGATHVAVPEDTLGDLIEEKRVEIVPAGSGVAVVPAADVRDRVLDQLEQRLPGGKVAADGASIAYDDGQALAGMHGMGMGYAERALADARASGLQLVARPVVELAASRAAVTATIDAAAQVKASIMLFGGQQVAGYRDLIGFVATEMQQRGIAFGYVEMARQFGDQELASRLKCKIIRCHALAAAELVKTSPQRAVDRFRQAVRERNVRLCYVRPYDLGTDDPLATAIAHVGDVAAAVRGVGFETGSPEAFGDLAVSRPALAVLLIATGAAVIWLIQLIFMLPAATFGWLVAADVVLSLGAAFGMHGMAQSLGSLGAAVVFPTLALLSVQLREPGGRPSFVAGLRLFLIISGISLIGGLIAAACLSDLPHMMQIAAFRGVKLAEVVPLLAVLAVFVARCTDGYAAVRTEMGSGLPEWPALWAGFVEAGNGMLRYWHVGLVVVALAGAALMLMRSGNTTPVPPSGLEMKLRSVLDHVLVVRPRSKEIALGHPALILTLAFLLAGWRRGAWIGMALGTIGQMSLVNTFGHIHTTLAISLIRIANGLWLGAVVGLVLWLIWGLAARYRTARRMRVGTSG